MCLAEAGFKNGVNSDCISRWLRVLTARRGDKIRHMFRYKCSVSFSVSLTSPLPPFSSLILSLCCFVAVEWCSFNCGLLSPEVAAWSE
jgi:hypothetical protein